MDTTYKELAHHPLRELDIEGRICFVLCNTYVLYVGSFYMNILLVYDKKYLRHFQKIY